MGGAMTNLKFKVLTKIFLIALLFTNVTRAASENDFVGTYQCQDVVMPLASTKKRLRKAELTYETSLRDIEISENENDEITIKRKNSKNVMENLDIIEVIKKDGELSKILSTKVTTLNDSMSSFDRIELLFYKLNNDYKISVSGTTQLNKIGVSPRAYNFAVDCEKQK
jgi:hypothetical protein